MKETERKESESETHSKSSGSVPSDGESASCNAGSSDKKEPFHWGFGDQAHLDELIAYYKHSAYRQTREQLLASDRLRKMAEVI